MGAVAILALFSLGIAAALSVFEVLDLSDKRCGGRVARAGSRGGVLGRRRGVRAPAVGAEAVVEVVRNDFDLVVDGGPGPCG